MNRLIAELHRRNVFRASVAYLVLAWLVVQVADILLETFEAPAWAMQVLVVVLGIGFIVTLVLAWLYELTSQGVKPDADVEGQVEPMFAGRRIDFLIIGVLTVALCLFASERFGWIDVGDQSRNEPYSIAVLPFAFLGPETDSEYFADAVTEELIGRLGRVGNVKVKSRLSVARYENAQELEIADIAVELGVELILEGSVRKSGERVRITTQLTETSSGFEQWSDVFDGESEDWFTLHENMATQIADSLGLHLSPEEDEAVRAHYTKNSEAYEEFWQGWLLLESFHADHRYPREKIVAAENHLERALELDTDYALAVAGLSLASSYMYFYAVDQTDARRQRAVELANRAVELNPHMAEGYVARGMAVGLYGDNLGSRHEFRKALEYDPGNGVAWCMLAAACLFQTPPDAKAAEAAARESIRADPTWTYSYQMLGLSLMLQERFEEAVEAFEQGAIYNPDYGNLLLDLGGGQMTIGRYEDALASFTDARKSAPSPRAAVAQAAASAMLGDTEQAFAYLQEGLEAGYVNLDGIRSNPYFDSIRTDPRFEELLSAEE